MRRRFYSATLPFEGCSWSGSLPSDLEAFATTIHHAGPYFLATSTERGKEAGGEALRYVKRRIP